MLVERVGRAVSAHEASRLVDLYSGVGLFAATVGRDHEVVAVESNPSAVADARQNAPAAVHVEQRVERWQGAGDIVIADPARRGLGDGGVAVIDRSGADTVLLVSCDAAAAARDVSALASRGFEIQSVQVLDLFPQTSHVEVLTTLTR